MRAILLKMLELGFPVWAGIDLTLYKPTPNVGGLPRVGGDRPGGGSGQLEGEPASPCGRG